MRAQSTPHTTPLTALLALVLLQAGCGFTRVPDKGDGLDAGFGEGGGGGAGGGGGGEGGQGGAGGQGGQDAALSDMGASPDMGGVGGEGGEGGGGEGGMGGNGGEGGEGGGGECVDDPLQLDAACDLDAPCCDTGLACSATTAIPSCQPTCVRTLDCGRDSYCDLTQPMPICRPFVACQPGDDDPCLCEAALPLDAQCDPGADCCEAETRCALAPFVDAVPTCRAPACDPLDPNACADPMRCWLIGFDAFDAVLGECRMAPAGVPEGSLCTVDPEGLAGECDAGLLCEVAVDNIARCVRPCPPADLPICGADRICLQGRCHDRCDPTQGCEGSRCQWISSDMTAPMEVVSIGVCVEPTQAETGAPCAIDVRGIDNCADTSALCDVRDLTCRTMCGPAFAAACAEGEACDLSQNMLAGVCVPVED